GSAGGGIANFGGTVSVIRSTISGNNAHASGGGIANDSATDSTPGTLTVIDSTISNNIGRNGGINNPNGGMLTLKNTTVSGNQATIGSGGGILNGISATATITNCTIVGNHADVNGGGIDNSASPQGTVTIKNTIIAGNTAQIAAGSDHGPDCDGPLNSLGHNLVQNVTSALAATDITGSPAMLGPLAGNGGPTQTHALSPCSPAVDAGDDSVLTDPDLMIDQRGLTRKARAHVDIGAYELQGLTLTVGPSTIAAGTRQSPYSQSFQASGGMAPYSFSITAGSLPDGLTLSGDSITGTPADSGNFTLTILVSDSNGDTGCQQYTLVIAGFSLTHLVTNTNDSGPGSLRQAIEDSEAGDKVVFDASLHGQTITLTSGALNISQGGSGISINW